jgi:hypothetical protein
MKSHCKFDLHCYKNSALKKAIQAHKRYQPQQTEMIKIIELDIRIENISLKDRFEWDINDPHNNPEVLNYLIYLLFSGFCMETL